MNRLPAELIDHIIDFQHSDGWTLKVCSLVCRQWLPASRFHLFGTVVVSPSKVQSFVRHLSSPSSTIANYVHTLQIHTYYNDMPVFDAITPYFKDFVVLKSVSLDGMDWDPIGETTLFKEFERSGNTKLTSVYHDFSDTWISLTFTLGESGPAASFSSTLRILNSITEPSSWLPIVMQIPAVGKVELFNIEESQLPTVQAVLKSGGQSIHTIKLGFTYEHQPSLALISDCVDLTHNTNLRSLSFFNLNLRNPKQLAGHGFFLKIVQRILSPSIAHIEINVSIDDRMDLIWLDCEKVADELNHPRFAKLQKVCVFLEDYCPDEDEAVDCVRREMSGLADRGILCLKA